MVLISLSLFLVFVFRSRLGLIGCALVFGGSAGNILGHVAFGPVADYIPEPFRNGSWECNPADLAIWTGSVMLVIALGFYLRDHYRYERVRGFRSSTARRESSSTSGRKGVSRGIFRRPTSREIRRKDPRKGDARRGGRQVLRLDFGGG